MRRQNRSTLSPSAGRRLPTTRRQLRALPPVHSRQPAPRLLLQAAARVHPRLPQTRHHQAARVLPRLPQVRRHRAASHLHRRRAPGHLLQRSCRRMVPQVPETAVILWTQRQRQPTAIWIRVLSFAQRSFVWGSQSSCFPTAQLFRSLLRDRWRICGRTNWIDDFTIK